MGESSREARRALNRAADAENRLWPAELVEFPIPPGSMAGMDEPAVRAWRSRRFLVQEYHDDTAAGVYVRLSVQRVEHAAFRTDAVEDPISWDDLMACKSQVGYGDYWAVEVYPPDGQVVDVARMRHLFMVPPEALPFAWRPADRKVVDR